MVMDVVVQQIFAKAQVNCSEQWNTQKLYVAPPPRAQIRERKEGAYMVGRRPYARSVEGVRSASMAGGSSNASSVLRVRSAFMIGGREHASHAESRALQS